MQNRFLVENIVVFKNAMKIFPEPCNDLLKNDVEATINKYLEKSEEITFSDQNLKKNYYSRP